MLPRITSLEPCDLPDFAALLRQDGHPPETFVTAHREHLSGDRTVLVARVGEAVGGFVSLLNRPRAGKASHEVSGWYVSIAHRGQGLGRLLLSAAEALAMTRGARQTALALPARCDPAALHLATRLGYECESDRLEPLTPWDSVRVLVKSLVPLPFRSAQALAA